ncbi:MAG TPA: four helix bundle protein [Chitinophagales bacterium]
MNDFKELNVWKDAITLASKVYLLSNVLPDYEKFGIVSQIRRAVVSISSNIAEGAGRNNKTEFYHFIGIARGSASEVQSLIYVCVELRYLKEVETTEIIESIIKIQNMLYKLQRTLK